VNERLAWRTILALSVVGAGAYVGSESPAREYSHYFWDLTGYVLALESEFPYRTTETFTFLYPPIAKDLFGLARTHLFEPNEYVQGVMTQTAVKRDFGWAPPRSVRMCLVHLSRLTSRRSRC
jgi:hypothetical protein